MPAVAKRKFGVSAERAAGHCPTDVDPVAGAPFGDLIAHSFDSAGGVRAGNVGQGRQAAVVAGTNVGVHGIDATGADADEHLPGGGR